MKWFLYRLAWRLIPHKHGEGYTHKKPLYGGGAHGADECIRCGLVFFWCYGNDHKTYVYSGWVRGTITMERQIE